MAKTLYNIFMAFFFGVVSICFGAFESMPLLK